MIPGLAAILHAAAQPGGKTYANFVEWAATQGATAVDALAWPGGAGGGTGLKILTLPLTLSGGMGGSPWGGAPAVGEFNSGSQYTRIAQHAFASPDHVAMNLGRVVVIHVQDQGYDSEKVSLTRNGYSSISFSEVNTWICNRFDYFNEATSKRVRVNPYMQSVEEFDLT